MKIASFSLSPLRRERVGARGPLGLARNRDIFAALPLRPHRSDSRRGPLTLGRFAPSTSPRAAGRGDEVRHYFLDFDLQQTNFLPGAKRRGDLMASLIVSFACNDAPINTSFTLLDPIARHGLGHQHVGDAFDVV